jgi:hypothetical protein
MMACIRNAQAALAAVPPAVQAQIDSFDPDGSAEAIGTFFSDGRPVGGRRMYGGRPAAWQALEDKTIIDALWDEAGVRRAPYAVVPAELSAMQAAAQELDQGLGTVWVGDNRHGFHGGAHLLRWIRSAEDEAEAAAFLSSQCDRVRVMPFLDGVPCSIHGIVFPDAVVALRPCEMIVFRVPGSSKLAYAAAGTFWDPPPADREEMRATARRVGAFLRERYGYAGVFTIDGIMSCEGFVPTELNPRYGAALGRLMKELPRLPLYLLHLALVEGEAIDVDPAALEALILRSADDPAHRVTQAGKMFKKRVEQTIEARLVHDVHDVHDGGGWRAAGADESPHARIELGPGPMGSYLRVFLDPQHTPIGAPAAPRVAEILAFASERWDLELEALEAARDVRAEQVAGAVSRPASADTG